MLIKSCRICRPTGRPGETNERTSGRFRTSPSQVNRPGATSFSSSVFPKTICSANSLTFIGSTILERVSLIHRRLVFTVTGKVYESAWKEDNLAAKLSQTLARTGQERKTPGSRSKGAGRYTVGCFFPQKRNELPDLDSNQGPSG